MTTVTVTSRMAAPVERVFDVFTDVEHRAEKVAGIKKIEMLTPGKFQLGTRWRETRHVMGTDVNEEMVVTAYERNRAYTVTVDAYGTRVDAVFSFEPTVEGTKVTIEFNLDAQSFSARLLAPVGWAMTGKIRDALAHDLADLKRAAEAPTAGA